VDAIDVDVADFDDVAQDPGVGGPGRRGEEGDCGRGRHDDE
jgi:hypothetical protein